MRRALLFALSIALPPFAAAAVFVAWPLPEVAPEPGPLRVTDRRGELLREVHGSRSGPSFLLRSPVPPRLEAAFLAAEDDGFHSHLGLSLRAIVRAAGQNLRAGRWVAGGSTLTQQLARLRVARPRSLWGKTTEALWALRLEAHLTKEEILLDYLNRLPLGHGWTGVETAGRGAFGKRAEDLSTAECAALAALARGPTLYDPYLRLARLTARQRWVLDRLGATGRLSRDEVERARNEPLVLRAPDHPFRAPHWVETQLSSLSARELDFATELTTTLDGTLQTDVEHFVDASLASLAERHVTQAAVLVIDNASHEVLAYVGSRRFDDASVAGQVDGVRQARQPGSALKPFVYLEGFRLGVTPASVLADLEVSYAADRGAYAPRNYDGRFHGPVRAREALASSFNIPAVGLTQKVGVERMLAALRGAGFDSLTLAPHHYGLGLALGNGEVTLWELGRAYSGLSRGGLLHPLRTVREARDASGRPLSLAAESLPVRFADAAHVSLVTDILSDNAARARAFGLDSALQLPFPAAVKTGTSKGYADNWAVGFTHERTVAVWVGNFDHTPMRQVSGVSGAGPLFRRVMTRAMEGLAPRPLYPERLLTRATICPLSGLLATGACPASLLERFAPGTAPREPCASHRGLPTPASSRCQAMADVRGVLTVLGSEYQGWARAEGLWEAPWQAAECVASALPGALTVISPATGEEFRLLDDLPPDDQAIPLRIQGAARETALEVQLDGRKVLTLTPPFEGRLPAAPGAHRLTLHRSGEAAILAESAFRVRAR